MRTCIKLWFTLRGQSRYNMDMHTPKYYINHINHDGVAHITIFLHPTPVGYGFSIVGIFDKSDRPSEDTFTTYEIQTWLPDIILGMDRFRNLTAWPVWVEVTGYIGNKTKISSLFIHRQLKFQLTAWQKWEIKLYKMGISPQSTQAVISLQWRCLRHPH